MVTFPEYETFDALDLAKLIKTRVISPLELLDAAIERIEAKNPALNAVIFKMYEEARQSIQSPLADGPFQGVPFLLKDLLAEYRDTPMCFGSRLMQGYISKEDSELVKRFRKAGLIMVGKTNLPEFGLSPTTEPELFGPTCNPWELTKSAGGSSGGSAAAVASGMVPMAHGGDGGGSLRIPAAYCGVFGLKPSRGRTPTGPHMMRIWQGMVVEHALTRSVRDSAALLDAISGPELGSPIALAKSKDSFLAALSLPLPPLRIAYTEESFFKSELHPEYRAALHKAVSLCEDLGHTMVPCTPQFNNKEVGLAYLIVIAADMAASIKMLLNSLPHKADYRDLETATAILCEVGEHFTAKDFVWASHVLDMLGKETAFFFTKYDLLMTPTMPGPPRLIGEFKPDRIEQNVLEILRRIPYGPLLRKLVRSISTKYFAFTPYTPLFNITGQPAMSVPLFWDTEGLPIGIQFAGHFKDEKTLFKLAYQLEETHPWKNRRPLMTHLLNSPSHHSN